MKKTIYIAIAALGFIACEPEFDNTISDAEASYSAGTADFSRYVSIGDSYSAGYADGTIYLHSQENSFPAILARQFSLVGGGSFTQPLVNDNVGGLIAGGAPILAVPNDPTTNLFPPRLVLNSNSSPVPMSGTSTTDITNVLSGSFNNIGVPGATSFHATVNGYGSLNPWYGRFASSPTASMFGDAMAQDPTFFTLWLGGNDILSYATSGGVGEDQNGAGNTNPLTYGSNDITHVGVLQQSIQGMVTALTADGATKGILCNVPSVTDIPYFTTVPYNAIPMDQATADATNISYAGYNAILGGLVQAMAISSQEAASRMVSFSAGQNPVLIVDETLTGISGIIQNPPFNVPAAQAALLDKLRPATANDLLVLPSSSVIGTLADPNNPASVMGVGVPLGDEYVLIPSEQAAIATAKTQYNAVIAAIANANPDVALVDMDSFLSQLNQTGLSYNGGTLYSTYATGGAFSLDGVHATGQGYAAISNIIIDAINSEFNANIPNVNPGFYTSIFFE